MSTVNVNRVVDASGGVLAPISSVMRNRIINGAMVIDQRNAGASVTPANGAYGIDRWVYGLTQASKFTAQQSTDAPVGFSFSNLITVGASANVTVGASDEFEVFQRIEGFNTADLGFGTANAKTVTLSFWVKSSLTGTFGGSLFNSAANRSYVFSYSISVANTWEQKSVTIAGDTTGTWVGATNGTGLSVLFSLGAGSSRIATAGSWQGAFNVGETGQTNLIATNSATWRITGVQLEVGTQATTYEYENYSVTLQKCQRYFQRYYLRSLYVNGSSYIAGGYPTQVPMRASPTVSFTDLAGTANRVSIGGVDNYAIAAGGLSGYVFSANTTGVLVDAIISSPPASSTWWAVNAIASIEL